MDALALAMKCSKLLHREDSIASCHDGSSQSAASYSSTISTTFCAERNPGRFYVLHIDGDDGLRASDSPVEEDRLSDVSVDISRVSKSGTSISESSLDLLTKMPDDDDIEDHTPYVAAPEEEMAEVRSCLDQIDSDTAVSF
jgi:hypothetical protein